MSNELLIESIKARQAIRAHNAKVESTVENVDFQADTNTEELQRLLGAINNDFRSATKVPADLRVINHKNILNSLNYPSPTTIPKPLFAPSMPVFLAERSRNLQAQQDLNTSLQQYQSSNNTNLDTLEAALRKAIADGDDLLREALTSGINSLQSKINNTNLALSNLDTSLRQVIASGDNSVRTSLTNTINALAAALRNESSQADSALSNSLNETISGLAASLRQELAAGDAKVKLELEAVIASLSANLSSAIANGDAAVKNALNLTISNLNQALREVIASGDLALKGELNTTISNLGTAIRGEITTRHAADLITYDARFLAIGAKAADSQKLDGLDSTSFLRSDTADSKTGDLTLTDGALNLTTGNINLTAGSAVFKNASGYWLSTVDKTGLYFNSTNPIDLKLELHEAGVVTDTLSLSTGEFSGNAATASTSSYVDIKDSDATDDFNPVAIADNSGKIKKSTRLQFSHKKYKLKVPNIHLSAYLTMGTHEEMSMRYNPGASSIEFIIN